MWIRRTCVLFCILLPAALLSSMGCGILAFPLEAPKLAIVNTKLISFTADIVDDKDIPLDGVTVTITRHALTPDLLFVENDDAKPEPERAVDKTFTYTTFGNYAVVVAYAKPSYTGTTIAYALEDDVEIHPHAVFWQAAQHIEISGKINTFKQPRSKVVLKQVQ